MRVVGIMVSTSLGLSARCSRLGRFDVLGGGAIDALYDILDEARRSFGSHHRACMEADESATSGGTNGCTIGGYWLSTGCQCRQI